MHEFAALGGSSMGAKASGFLSCSTLCFSAAAFYALSCDFSATLYHFRQYARNSKAGHQFLFDDAALHLNSSAKCARLLDLARRRAR